MREDASQLIRVEAVKALHNIRPLLDLANRQLLLIITQDVETLEVSPP